MSIPTAIIVAALCFLNGYIFHAIIVRVRAVILARRLERHYAAQVRFCNMAIQLRREGRAAELCTPPSYEEYGEG